MLGVYSWGAGKSVTTPEQVCRFVVSAFCHGRRASVAWEFSPLSSSGDSLRTCSAERAGDGEWRA